MDLNNLKNFEKLDTENMIAHINDLPSQLEKAWELGKGLELPDWQDIHTVIVAGMGGSAIGGDLLAAFAESHGTIPIFVHRDYDLPAWAKGSQTLVVCSSHSGNTEETLSAFEAAMAQGCRIMTVTTGGKLAEAAKENNAILWKFTYDSQPRAAIHHSFGLLLAAFTRLGVLPDVEKELKSAVTAMKRQQKKLLPEVKDTINPAKRLAGQLIGRWITIYGSGVLAPVARRWKTQINEIAKAQASFEVIPEADHNTLEGISQPESESGCRMNLFLQAPSYHPRNKLREEFTRMTFMLEGINTDFVKSRGETALANIWTSLHFGDYTAYYLAMAYGIDPTPVPMLVELKEKMQAAE
ncbi:MAG: bifunctional phosphoglucose/phosphomannose isomerase [Chloroflexi bacterium]|nr:bifunctional phosphoglucose/phosphomannose isomerase [Chloroflexota bacterium]